MIVVNAVGGLVWSVGWCEVGFGFGVVVVALVLDLRFPGCFVFLWVGII